MITVNGNNSTTETNPSNNNVTPENNPSNNSTTGTNPSNTTSTTENDSAVQNNTVNFNDPNAITVTITDQKTPIIVLYGPPACGKTMTLVRLARYLRKNQYTIVPDKSFRDSNDAGYQNLCDNFDNIIASNDAANSTDIISFMLIKVLDNHGHPVCQILEAPGEGYYDPQNNKKGFPPYVNKIINSNNRKVWAVFVEPNWLNINDRSGYVNNIVKLNSQITSKSKILFVYNKVDTTSVQTESDSIQEVMNLYPNIFEPFKNQNPISKWWRKYNCNLVRFETGTYNNKYDGGVTFTESDDSYPRLLWQNLLKLIRG